MADESVTGAIGGIASGAAAGASFGPVGAVVGGIIGGIGGLMGGNAAKKARKYQNIAAAFEAKSKIQQAALARRDMIRQARVAQANAIAFAASEEGGLQSSASQGALASSESQLGFGLNYLKTQFELQRGVTTNLQKAGKYQAQAQDILGLTSTLTSAIQTIGPTIPRTPPAPMVGSSLPGVGFGNAVSTPTAPQPQIRYS